MTRNVAPASMARCAASIERTVPAPSTTPFDAAARGDRLDRSEGVGLGVVEGQLERPNAAVGKRGEDVSATGRGDATADRDDTRGRDAVRDRGSRDRHCHAVASAADQRWDGLTG